MRFEEPGYKQVSLPDPAGRRGLWIRRTPPHEDDRDALPETIELCAGREGDDDYVKISVGDTITGKTLDALESVVGRIRWAEEHREWEIDWKNPKVQEIALLIAESRATLLDAQRAMEKLHDKAKP